MSTITDRIRSYLAREEFYHTLTGLCPPGADVKRIAGAYISAVATEPKLQRFDLAKHLAALTKCVRMGLHPGPLSHVYLIAQRGIIDAVPSYKGLIARLKRQPNVRSIEAHCVYSLDEFTLKGGTQPTIEHQIRFTERGDFAGVYAVIFYTDGTYQFDYMTAEEVDRVKTNTRGGGSASSPWVKWHDQMSKKSIIRRLISFAGFDDTGLGEIVLADEPALDQQTDLNDGPVTNTDSPLGEILDHAERSTAPDDDSVVSE